MEQKSQLAVGGEGVIVIFKATAHLTTHVFGACLDEVL